MNETTDRLFYDAHAKNVIVECKDGRDLEDLIDSGDLSAPDLAKLVCVLFMSTDPDLQKTSDNIYVWEKLGNMELNISGVKTEFYLYLRNISRNKSIPSGTVVFAEFNNVDTIKKLGGDWEALGEADFNISGNKKVFYAYKKL
mgnify:FL=1